MHLNDLNAHPQCVKIKTGCWDIHLPFDALKNSISMFITCHDHLMH